MAQENDQGPETMDLNDIKLPFFKMPEGGNELFGAPVQISVNGWHVPVAPKEGESIEQAAQRAAEKVKELIIRELTEIRAEKEAAGEIQLARPIDEILKDLH